MDLPKTLHNIMNQIPPCARFNKQDEEIIIKHKDTLLQWENDLVTGFYDTLFAHDETRAVFTDDERSAREDSFREWYQRTVNGPFDDTYWQWQAFVGLIHIKRRVTNTMVSSMWSWILNFLTIRIIDELDPKTARDILAALQHLQGTVVALIVDTYVASYHEAITRSTGMNVVLLDRLVETEIDQMIVEAR